MTEADACLALVRKLSEACGNEPRHLAFIALTTVAAYEMGAIVGEGCPEECSLAWQALEALNRHATAVRDAGISPPPLVPSS